MNKNSLLLAAGFSALICVSDAQTNEIDQITQMMNMLESKFSNKVIAVVNEDYGSVSKKVLRVEESSHICKKSPPFEHWIAGDKTKTMVYNCTGNGDGKYVISQSISKGKKLSDGTVCKNVAFYYFSLVDGILYRAEAAGIENKKKKSVYVDTQCDDIN